GQGGHPFRHRAALRLPLGDGGAGRRRARPDRRVLVHPRAGRARRGPGRRRRLQRHAGGLALLHPVQRAPRPSRHVLARAPVALPEIERARLAVAAGRALRPEVPLLARAHGRAEAEALRAKGATEIIQPELEASATLIRHALAALGLPKDRTIAYLERYRSAMERADAGGVAAVALPEVHELALGAGGITDRS